MKHVFCRCILFFGVVLLAGCLGPRIVGKFDGKTYTSAHQDFSVPMPELMEGGRVSGDDDEGVTFSDDYGSRISFYSYAFGQDSIFGSDLRSGGNEKALNACFTALGIHSIAAHFHAEVKGGILSGVYFKPANKPSGDVPSGIKTSIAAFIQSNHVCLVEIGLPFAARVLSKNADEATLHRQDERMENQAIALVQSIQPK